MNSNAVISAVVALSLTTGGFAFAQGNSGHNDQGRNEQSQRGNQQDRRDNDRHDNGRRGNDRNDKDRHDNGRRDNQGRAHQDEHRDGRGAGPNHAFHRGDRLPMEYRHRHYVVDDWRGYHLSAPPHGSHWVQTGGDYVLVVIATGIILQLFLGS